MYAVAHHLFSLLLKIKDFFRLSVVDCKSHTLHLFLIALISPIFSIQVNSILLASGVDCHVLPLW